MSRLDSDTLVVGAGLVGAACAFRLAQAGREVMLVDAQAPGLGASFGNAGHIATEQLVPLANPEVIGGAWRYLLAAQSPLQVRAAYLLPILPWLARFVWAARPASLARGIAALIALQRTSLTDLQDLLVQAGLAPLLHQDGYLRIWESGAGAAEAKRQAAQMQTHGVRSDAMSAAAVRAQAPGLNAELGGAVFFPDTGHVSDPHAVCIGLVEAMQRQGGQVAKARVVELFQDRRGPVRLTLADGRVLHSRQVLVCAGAWSRPLASSLGYRVPLDTERGYSITVPWPGAGERAPSTMQMRRPIASTERSVIMTPMSVGLRMTGTLEFGGLKLPPDQGRYALLRHHMQALLPGTDTDNASNWMGFRPSLPDHLPVLGAAPRQRGVFFAFGHQHLGLTLCGVTARIMTDLMMERSVSVDLAPYHVERFRLW